MPKFLRISWSEILSSQERTTHKVMNVGSSTLIRKHHASRLNTPELERLPFFARRIATLGYEPWHFTGASCDPPIWNLG